MADEFRLRKVAHRCEIDLVEGRMSIKERLARMFHSHCEHTETFEVQREHGKFHPHPTKHLEVRNTCCRCGRITVGTIYPSEVRAAWEDTPDVR